MPYEKVISTTKDLAHDLAHRSGTLRFLSVKMVMVDRVDKYITFYLTSEIRTLIFAEINHPRSNPDGNRTLNPGTMSVTYTLKSPQTGVKPKDQKATPILCTTHFDGQRLKIGIGESILPKDWNSNTHRPRATAPSSASLTTYLDRLAVKIREIHLQLKADFVPITPESLKLAVLRDIKQGGNKQTFLQYFVEFIEGKKAANPKNIGMYNSVLKNLKKYPGAKNFNDITPEWFTRFQGFMENYREENVVNNGYSANYISRTITVIREVMAGAKKAGLHRNEAYKDTDYKKPSERVENIYLTTDELMLMYNCPGLTPNETKVMYRFMVSAFTGLRFSDVENFSKDNIRDEMIYCRNIKTGMNVVIPEHRIIKEIMAKFPEGLPKGLSNQKSNDALKKIGDKAKINTPILRNQVRGGNIVTTTQPKFELITTHAGRRSYATNASLAGMNDQAIMMVTGHTTATSFQKYLKMSQEDSARAIKDHQFFK